MSPVFIFFAVALLIAFFFTRAWLTRLLQEHCPVWPVKSFLSCLKELGLPSAGKSPFRAERHREREKRDWLAERIGFEPMVAPMYSEESKAKDWRAETIGFELTVEFYEKFRLRWRQIDISGEPWPTEKEERAIFGTTGDSHRK